jgi:hypothetical protein
MSNHGGTEATEKAALVLQAVHLSMPELEALPLSKGSKSGGEE